MPDAANDNTAPSSAATGTPKPKACPICGKPATERLKPFCSARCADVDLHRWLGGAYAVTTSADDPSAGDGEG